MNTEDALSAEQRFVDALVGGDAASLSGMLTDDFVLIDPITGGETPRAMFLLALDSGALRFPVLKRDNAKVRLYDHTALVTGSAYMQLCMGQETLTVSARYTHVYVQGADCIKVASAQATSVPAGVK